MGNVRHSFADIGTMERNILYPLIAGPCLMGIERRGRGLCKLYINGLNISKWNWKPLHYHLLYRTVVQKGFGRRKLSRKSNFNASAAFFDYNSGLLF